MKATDLKIGNYVHIGIFSSINGANPNDTVYLDFEGNEGDIWEEEVQNLVFAKTELKKQ